MCSSLNAAVAFITVSAVIWLYIEKRHNRELEADLEDMEKALKVSRNIKHEQNNLFQSIIYYIENKQWDSAREFIDEILIKTSEFNKNNFLQLMKIKNYNIRNAISKIMGACDDNAIKLEVIVTWDADHINIHDSVVCNVIGGFYNNIADQVIGSCEKEIAIEVCSNSQGFSFIISNTFKAGQETTAKSMGLPTFTKIMLKFSKNIVLNSYAENERYRQEIMVI